MDSRCRRNRFQLRTPRISSRSRRRCCASTRPADIPIWAAWPRNSSRRGSDMPTSSSPASTSSSTPSSATTPKRGAEPLSSRIRSRRMDTLTRYAQPWIDRAARIGADPLDTDEIRLRKALLVIVSLGILPISLAWGAIYLALGTWAGLIAWLYSAISIAAILIFARTRDTEWLLRVELLDILLAPTISMAFVGGFIPSGAVGLWGILAPLGALVFNGARSGVRWFVAFVAVFLVSGTVGQVAGDA